ncbi:MAG: Lrp/AsnC ligand binding domain-containing protein [Candidatus Hodarchaeales archaeon]|jgi:DNA-binding Lrp family transcriptional regulator
MVDAVVLLCVYPGKEHLVKEEIAKIDQVKSCRITFGEYDLVVEVQTDKVKSLGTLMTKRIRAIEGITKSVTLIISESLENSNPI